MKVNPFTFGILVEKFFKPSWSTIAYLTDGFASAEAIIASATAKPTPIINVHFLSTNFLIFGPYSEDDAAGKYSTVDAHPFFLEAVAPAH